MPILKRQDGVQFAIHPYRELITYQKKSVLKNKINTLAENHGQYVRLFKLSNNQIEGVFSHDSGFLLGETIWHYFNKPNDLIYCEALPDNHNVIVIIILAGSVYLDSKLPKELLYDELASLLATQTQYEIYIYGDVGLSSQRNPNKFTFEPAYIKHFTELKEPLFEKIPTSELFQLQPLMLALNTQHLLPSRGLWWGGVATTAIIALGVGLWRFNQQSITPTSVTAVNPYQFYEEALQTPAPNQVLKEFIGTVIMSNSISGWQPTRIDLTGQQYQVNLQSIGGNASQLVNFAQQHNFNLQFTSNGANITIPSQLHPRPPIKKITKQNQAISQVLDTLQPLLANVQIQLGTTYYQGSVAETPLTLNFNDTALPVMLLIGQKLQGLPIQLKSITNTATNGLLSGKIELVILGSA